ncbi:hypothetical protein PENTCL1PPCAC_27561 [Pristionchus entomophagus]|uniref:Cytosol aminopeptidase domain-containing protein n=1 Tax=Pristionchus entomophagus TaxID=358040 RepID=A0AAV5UFM9_9BILA|nr:hypothetical protein PENTCL1PPCAC_27561 [Pristionchus entomophagus]
MTTNERITVIKGPTTEKFTKDNAIVFAGRSSMLRKIKFDASMSANMNGLVTETCWKACLDALPEQGGSLPLHANKYKFIALPSRRSRYTSRANTHVLAEQLRSTKLPESCKDLRVILVCEYEHALALVSSVARTFPLYSRKKDFAPLNVVVEVVCMDKDLNPADVSLLSDLACSIRTTARLVDIPANEMTTDRYVEEAVAIGKKLGCGTTVIQGEDLLKKGFGGIYHVGKAGPTPPAFVVLSHEPSGAKDTFALVGKGIMYDCGGMHIKTGTHMLGMKRDMAGSAALLGAFVALVKAKFSQNLHVCLCIAENNISPAANKPDDVITLLSGRTVEITNTDAEGRIVLADGVYYAKNTLKANHIINMATLTGSQAYMTGKTHAAMMCSQEESEQKMVSAGLHSGDLVHPMIYAPDMHEVDLYSPVADMNNANYGDIQNLLPPRSAAAALFIGSNIEYGEGLDWIHLDMLAPSHCEGRSTAWGVSLVVTALGAATSVPLLHTIGQ